ncbi:macro domain-containing protein LMOf2365_2748-like [Amphiura filiformis]|uniref:macro domain-containing protein LMOf2365_2748-like n=1 Tax=Amphiura filiformis TaxID=82378 RepID=UPI003B214C54
MSASARISSIVVEVQNGDITEEMSMAIVNSVSGGPLYGGGQVTKAINDAAGGSIAKEYEASYASEATDIVITSAGKLEQSKIFHLTATTNPTALKDMVRRTLEKAESEGMDSISFPALGTGDLGCDPKRMAAPMFEAMRDFGLQQGKYGSIDTIKVVIYKETLFQQYKKAMYDTIGEYCAPDEDDDDDSDESPPE